MAQDASFTYQNLFYPILLFILIQITIDFVWRISDIAEWKAEPCVRQSILLTSYDYVQHHGYEFFQNNFIGALSSKMKGILDGYDKFWDEVHLGVLAKILKIVVSLSALAFMNKNLGIFAFIWIFLYILLLYKLSLKLNKLSFKETESRHAVISLVSDNLTNIISHFIFFKKERAQEIEREYGL